MLKINEANLNEPEGQRYSYEIHTDVDAVKFYFQTKRGGFYIDMWVSDAEDFAKWINKAVKNARKLRDTENAR